MLQRIGLKETSAMTAGSSPKRGSGPHAWRKLWSWLRHVSGDAAYDAYLEYAKRNAQVMGTTRCSQASKTLSRSEFYLDSVRRRYSTVSRCC